MTFALARSLLLADAVKPEALAAALLVSATRGTSLVRALLAARAIERAELEQHLERGDAPFMRHVAPVSSLVHQLPAEICERLLALPVRRDPMTGTVDVAVVDARDPHPVEEIAHWLRAPVRMVRTPLASMEAALRHLHAKPTERVRLLAAPIWVPSTTPPTGVDPMRAHAETPSYGSPTYNEDPPLGGDRASGRGPGKKPEIEALVGPPPNIPIPLTRKSVAPVAIVEMAVSAVRGLSRADEREPVTDPILDLRRRKLPGSDANDSPAPATSRGPFPPAPSAPVLAKRAPMLDAIQSAANRDEILQHLLVGVHEAARRVAIFAVKRDLLIGWTCTHEMADPTTLRAARVVAPAGSALAAALGSSDAILARIPKDAAHAPLLAALYEPPADEVALVAVRVDGKPVALVLADEPTDALVATKQMQELARAAGDALARWLREKRK
jgi:hypothetical protein